MVSALHAFGTVVFWADELVPGAVSGGLALPTWEGWVMFEPRDESAVNPYAGLIAGSVFPFCSQHGCKLQNGITFLG